MRAILIDPTTQTIVEVDYDNSSYKNIYKLIDAEPFTTLDIKPNESIYLDDEGLLRDPPKPLFAWADYRQPLAGKGLILGFDDEGETVATKVTLAYVKSMVRWLPDMELKRFDAIPDGAKTVHPVLGEVSVIGARPVFGKKD